MANNHVETSKESQGGAKAAASGGRSERQADQRNEEQAAKGHDKSAEVPRDAVRSVKSEPHWDPSEPSNGSNAKK